MIYEFICDLCGATETIETPITEEIPKHIPCRACSHSTGEKVLMRRNWKGTTAVHVPDNFKAVNGAAPWDGRYGKFPPGMKGKYF